jgi:hypothetical protein
LPLTQSSEDPDGSGILINDDDIRNGVIPDDGIDGDEDGMCPWTTSLIENGVGEEGMDRLAISKSR